MKSLQKLGYPPNTKLLIIHADDAGLSHSENLATIQALQEGHVNSYSIMTCCPGFEEIAEFAISHPQFDYGIHLTITCEWENYKWGPTLSTDEVPSLVDSNGHFHKSKDDFIKSNASLIEIKDELCSQIDKALKLGLKPTHLDCHMYTLGLSLELLEIYKELGTEYNLPVFLSKQFLKSFGIAKDKVVSKDDFCIDNDVIIGNFNQFKNGNLTEYYEHLLSNMKSGLNIMLLHPAIDNQEMQDITIKHPNFGSEWRQIDLDFILSKKCKNILINNDIQLITWGEIKDKIYQNKK